MTKSTTQSNIVELDATEVLAGNTRVPLRRGVCPCCGEDLWLATTQERMRVVLCQLRGPMLGQQRYHLLDDAID